ncbi:MULTISPECIES: hypothetical protein [Sphingobium]|uniref:hypothetical protein n=1 Tax=Sphingobium TaxID=165695 RepID=UPI001113B0CF|nr:MULTISPECIES: hypothetical protein [Sphingobium]WDA38395.1 hypothetical protein PO876_09550 [Sphingobium sp. YC-XJ3]
MMTSDDLSACPRHDDGEHLPDRRALKHALATLKIAQRLLAGRGTDLAGEHVQLAIDLIAPLARHQHSLSLASDQRSNRGCTALVRSREQHGDCLQVRTPHHGHREASVSTFPALRASSSTLAATPESDTSTRILTA